MRLKFLFIISLAMLTSCRQNKVINEEIAVISYMYKTIPKVVPPPPAPSQTTEFDSIENQIDYTKLEPIYFRYAIYYQFDNSGLDGYINKSFFKANSEKFFERKEIDSSDFVLIKKLRDKYKNEQINKELLDSYVNENLLYLNKRFISKEAKEKREYNIDGIITFSKVSFNNQKDRAALAIGIHRGKLDSNLTVYILEKNQETWNIKYYKTISKS